MPSKASSHTPNLLRRIPSVDQMVNNPVFRDVLVDAGRDLFLLCLRELLEDLRAKVKTKKLREEEINALLREDSLRNAVQERIAARRRPKLSRVINATGVILHTGLGRAPLPKTAIEAIVQEQSGYSLLEVDRESGIRSIRETHIVALLQEIAGAEAATVVNNNAAATFLSLATLAIGREVIVARGQLVEIGGSFRIPEVMEQSGAKLVEVGTTNKTYLEDYERKIGPQTALLLKVHTSNYRIMGFTHSVSLEELVSLGRKHKLPVMDDLGSGAFIDLSPLGITDEPTVQESLKAGADVITFSGDKLLGGPQAGFILGKKEVVGRIRKHPLFRALRVDKLKLTGIEATLKLYLDRERLMREHPTLRMIAMSADEVEKRALDLAARVKPIPSLSVEILADHSEIGGGAVPTQTLSTRCVAIRLKGLSLDELSRQLRLNTPPIFTRTQRDFVLLDVRTLLDGEAEEIGAALRRIAH